MFCIANPYDIYGDFNSATAANLMVVFDVCDPSKGNIACKSPYEISKALQYSYILLVENYEHYKPENHGMNSNEPI